MFNRLIQQLKRHEGYRKHAYLCTAGKTTIGYGFNIEAGINKEDAEALLISQIDQLWEQCEGEFKWFNSLSACRQAVVVNMVFNLGMNGFKGFKKMIACIEQDRDEGVVHEMLDSKWAHQVKGRAWELADQWLQDSWQDTLYR